MADKKYQEAVAYLKNRKSGTLRELTDNFGTEMVEQLCKTGLISRGKVWQITEQGEKEFDFFYKKLTSHEAAIAREFAPRHLKDTLSD